jgi:hypothetical protein
VRLDRLGVFEFQRGNEPFSGPPCLSFKHTNIQLLLMKGVLLRCQESGLTGWPVGNIADEKVCDLPENPPVKWGRNSCEMPSLPG